MKPFDDFIVPTACMTEKDYLNRPTEVMDIIEYYYGNRYMIANFVKPDSIFEIGVNAGYSGYAFKLACPHATYTGVDLNQGTDGGTVGFVENAKRIIPDGRFFIGDSHDLLDSSKWATNFSPDISEFMHQHYDLVNVDGDHSAEGAYQDLLVAVHLVSQSGYILIDDLTNLPSTVGEGVLQAAHEGIISGGLLLQDMGGQLLIPPDCWHVSDERKVNILFIKMLKRFMQRRDWTLYPHHLGLKHW